MERCYHYYIPPANGDGISSLFALFRSKPSRPPEPTIIFEKENRNNFISLLQHRERKTSAAMNSIAMAGCLSALNIMVKSPHQCHIIHACMLFYAPLAMPDESRHWLVGMFRFGRAWFSLMRVGRETHIYLFVGFVWHSGGAYKVDLCMKYT